MGDYGIHREIYELHTELNKLRAEFTQDLLKKTTKDSIKWLEKLEQFQRQINEDPKLLQLPQTTKQLDVDLEKFNQLRAELKKQILLMEILIHKADCPISQVVDPL